MANASAAGRVSGHRSIFSQTCNRLSQYVKEKKAIGDLNLGMFGNGDEQGSNDVVFRPATMNLFPVNNKPEEAINSNSNSTALGSPAPISESKSPQMTIFYAGQVIVINDFPPHKAKEIMELASQGISQKPKEIMEMQEGAQQTATPVITDLPIARKASLHRFLEKRKDRIKAKAPYNTSKVEDESNSWLGLAAAQPCVRSQN